jgi:3-methyl-2-oxobutanoate hydroxymethyltransferase
MGRYLVFHDLFNLTFAPRAKFARQYGDAAGLFAEGLKRYREDVAGRRFPSDEESYHLPREVRAAVGVEAEVGELVARKA